MRRPVRIRDTGATDRHQAVAVIQPCSASAALTTPPTPITGTCARVSERMAQGIFNQRVGIAVSTIEAQRGANREVE